MEKVLFIVGLVLFIGGIMMSIRLFAKYTEEAHYEARTEEREYVQEKRRLELKILRKQAGE